MRLTVKGLDIHKTSMFLRCQQAYDLYDYVQKMEDIEERYSIDLATLFQALANGIYYKKRNGTIHFRKRVMLKFKGTDLSFYGKGFQGSVWLADARCHGTEWGLAKEELE